MTNGIFLSDFQFQKLCFVFLNKTFLSFKAKTISFIEPRSVKINTLIEQINDNSIAGSPMQTKKMSSSQTFLFVISSNQNPPTAE